MDFGTSVSALLETFDNCISLLKAFKRPNKDNGSRKVHRSSNQQSLLRHSLKTDRKKVERAYSSRLSEAGSSFEKGDSKSRSALSRVLRKLNAAIAKLMRLASKGESPDLDYQSLMSLSNASRLQAIKTFDRLSHRISSKSSGTSVVAPEKTSRSSKTAKISASPGDKVYDVPPSSSASSKDDRRRRDPKLPRGHGHGHGNDARARRSRSKGRRSRVDHGHGHDQMPPGTLVPLAPTTPPLAPPLDPTTRSSDGDGADGGTSKTHHGRRTTTASSLKNRFSLISMSSDSTRLGEIPERKWHRRYDPLDGSVDEYNTPIMYPIRPYQAPPPTTKGGRFLGLFRRG
ncbi:hypothetical protein VPNG_02301 [Cytospora leucostoma]|uniref:Uncharacterized protein n=1 Tax=Cytospora leucostoma TaxID=1230097 RepID=A0A423XH76_9PEZI|nr:hypothetical protein VPNG_02301 [Cytospora leucostoma]